MEIDEICCHVNKRHNVIHTFQDSKTMYFAYNEHETMYYFKLQTICISIIMKISVYVLFSEDVLLIEHWAQFH